MDYRGASVRAGVWLLALLQLPRQSGHLAVSQDFARSYGSVARQRIGSAIPPGFNVSTLRHLVQHVDECPNWVNFHEDAGHPAQYIDIAAERLYQKPETAEQMLVCVCQFPLPGVKLNSERLQQPL